MITRTTIIIGLFTFWLASCSETTEATDDQIEELANQEKELENGSTKTIAAESEAPKVVSFDEKSVFTITTESVDINPNTGTENIDLYLNNKLFDAPIKLSQELSMYKVKPGESGVPNNAVFAYNTWFAGGGEVYYGVVKDGILQINRKFEDEGMTEDAQFSLYREIDPNVFTKNPTYFISYTSDDKTSKELMIAFTENGKALFAKYYGQPRHIELRFKKDESEGRNIIEIYDEIVNGEVNGTYKLSHSGNYDYAEYTNKKSGKKYTFIIDLDVSIMGDTYRTVPSF